MNIFSFFKKDKKLVCNWCGKEMDNIGYIKYINKTKYNFCSEICKKNFRKSGIGKSVSCPTCALRR